MREHAAPTPAGKALPQEFPNFEAYAAYKRAEARGAVWRHRGAVVTA